MDHRCSAADTKTSHSIVLEVLRVVMDSKARTTLQVKFSVYTGPAYQTMAVSREVAADLAVSLSTARMELPRPSLPASMRRLRSD